MWRACGRVSGEHCGQQPHTDPMTVSAWGPDLWNENIHPQKDLHVNVHRRFTHSRQKSQCTQYLLPLSQWVTHLWRCCTVEYYSTMKRKTSLKHTERKTLKSLGWVREAWPEMWWLTWLHLHETQQEWIYWDKKEVSVGLGTRAQLHCKGRKRNLGWWGCSVSWLGYWYSVQILLKNSLHCALKQVCYIQLIAQNTFKK